MEKTNLELGLDVERILELVFDNSPDILLIVDRNLKVIKANKIFKSKVGDNEIIGKHCEEVVNERCVKHIKQILDSTNNNSCIKHFNRCLFNKDDDDTWYEVHSCPINNKDCFDLVSLHIKDITLQKKLEAQLSEQNERLWLLHEIDKSMHGVKEFNTLLKIILNGIIKLGYNSASLFFVMEKSNMAEGILSTNIPREDINKIQITLEDENGILAQTVASKKLIFIRDIKDPMRHFNINSDLLATFKGRSVLSIPLILGDKVKGVILIDNLKELTLKQKDLQILELFATKAAITINNAELYGRLYKFNKELSKKVEEATIELKIKNTKLKDLDKTKTALLSIVSHELRTPLTSIKGYASLFKNNTFGDLNDKQKDPIDIIINESDKLKDLITSVIDLSRLVSGKDSLNTEYIDLCDIINESIYETEVLAEEKNINIHFIHHGIEHKIYLDPEKIKLVVINLLSNAIKFNKIGGDIKIHLIDTPHFVQVNIEDTGIGVPKEQIEKIFEQFFQLEEHMTRAGGGAGIGLSIVKEIVNMHQGEVWVTSIPNKSTEFCFTLPKKIRITKTEKEEDELIKALNELETLRTILNIIHGKSTLKQTLELILEGIKETIGFDRVRLYLIDENREYLRGAVGINSPKDFDNIQFKAVGDKFIEDLFNEKKAKVYHYYENSKLNEKIGMTNETPFAAMPIYVRGEVIGMISADNMLSQKIITRKGLDSFTNFVNSASIAITNATVLEETERRVNERTKELQTINTKLKEIDLRKNDFLNYISHELRTPLTSLIGYSKLLLSRETFSEEDKKRSIEIIHKEAQRLKRMIDDLLDLSKLEEGVMEMKKTPSNVYQVIGEVIDTMRPVIKNKNLKINIKGDKIPGQIDFDKDKIEQVLMNLISNAVKFTEKGDITVNVKNEDKEIIIFVKDTGIGISNKDFEKIFDKFKQIDNQIKTEKGSGLGLAISKFIIEAHGGKIWFESKLGEGTIFYFSLPK